MALSFPPRKDSPRFDDWMLSLWRLIGQPAEGDPGDHTQLTNLNSDGFTHLTGSQASALTGGADTTLHYHASDRNRANHTGTQTASTISDFAAAVQAVESSSTVLESQVFGA